MIKYHDIAKIPDCKANLCKSGSSRRRLHNNVSIVRYQRVDGKVSSALQSYKNPGPQCKSPLWKPVDTRQIFPSQIVMFLLLILKHIFTLQRLEPVISNFVIPIWIFISNLNDITRDMRKSRIRSSFRSVLNIVYCFVQEGCKVVITAAALISLCTK